MKLKSVFLTAIVLAMSAITMAQDSPRYPNGLRGFSMTSTFQFDGKEYTYQLSTEAIKDDPSWNVSDGDPPLSVFNAVEIGKIQLKKLIKKTKGWNVDAVSLHEADTGKWYYDIHFRCIESGCLDKAAGGFTILLRMDGSAVEPKITPVPNTRR